jgi:hypothetical protein
VVDVKGSNKVADEALAAAKAQSVTLPAQEVASRIVAELANTESHYNTAVSKALRQPLRSSLSQP